MFSKIPIDFWYCRSMSALSADGARLLLLRAVQPHCEALLGGDLGLRQDLRPPSGLRHSRMRPGLPSRRLRPLRQNQYPKLCLQTH